MKTKEMGIPAVVNTQISWSDLPRPRNAIFYNPKRSNCRRQLAREFLIPVAIQANLGSSGVLPWPSGPMLPFFQYESQDPSSSLSFVQNVFSETAGKGNPPGQLPPPAAVGFPPLPHRFLRRGRDIRPRQSPRVRMPPFLFSSSSKIE